MTYRERMERRAERRREWAEKREAKGADASRRSHEIIADIPFGQPILVGHHSEKRHRKALDRSWELMGKGVEHREMAHRHELAADTIERNLARSIYDDDPDAIERLEQKLSALQQRQETMKAVNRIIKRKRGTEDERIAEVVALGFTPEKARVLVEGDRFSGQGFPSYALSNNNGNIKRTRDRIASIKERNRNRQVAEDAGGVTIKRGDEYCNIIFAEAPPRETRQALKAAGFFYSKGKWMGKTANIPECIEQ